MNSGCIPARPAGARRLIFRAWKTVGGQRLYARDYGYRAWPIWI